MDVFVLAVAALCVLLVWKLFNRSSNSSPHREGSPHPRPVHHHHKEPLTSTAAVKKAVPVQSSNASNTTTSSTVKFQLCSTSPLQGYTFLSATPLGEGGYGTTHLVTKTYGTHSGQHYVLKRIPVSNLTEANEALHEAQHLQRLRHPNVVRVFDAFLHANQSAVLEIAIVMEYCPRGDMYHAIKERKPITERKLTDWCGQLCAALAAIHDADMIHRDVKPDNIFISSDDTLRLGDFGLAKYIPHTDVLLSGGAANLSVAGSLSYMAPELVAEQPYGTSADIYSMGLVLLELSIGEIIGDTEAFQKLKGGIEEENAFLLQHVEKIPTRFATRKPLAAVIRLMLNIDPSRRSTMPAIIDRFAGLLWSHDLVTTAIQHHHHHHDTHDVPSFVQRSFSVPADPRSRSPTPRFQFRGSRQANQGQGQGRSSILLQAAAQASGTAASTAAAATPFMTAISHRKTSRQAAQTTGAITRAKSKIAARQAPRRSKPNNAGQAVARPPQKVAAAIHAKKVVPSRLIKIQSDCMQQIDEEEDATDTDTDVVVAAPSTRPQKRRRNSSSVSKGKKASKIPLLKKTRRPTK